MLEFSATNGKLFHVFGDEISGSRSTRIYRASLGSKTIAIKTWHVFEGDQKAFNKTLKKESEKWIETGSHPHIIQCIGVAFNPAASLDETPSLILPYYKNGNALQYLSSNPRADALFILTGIADALKYLHNQNPPIIHGRVRGSNILISDDGMPLLSDIGMGTLPLTDGHSLSDIRWQAPEIIEAEIPYISLAGDTYSFGMTMLEVLTRERPFAEIRTYRLITIIAQSDSFPRPQRPSTRFSAMTDGIWNLLNWCWDVSPKMRPTMREIYASLASQRKLTCGNDAHLEILSRTA